jgi:DNA repair exonuclease SbcCD ATPase subunit
MNIISLPELSSIEIKNFSLYPNGQDFKHNFINGVNLIVGGNGMGKTTFVNIIKFAIIGHYKESFDFTRTYLDKKIEKRIALPWNYYLKREDDSIIFDSFPFVKVEFFLNGTSFKLKRRLDEVELVEVKINNELIIGDKVNQRNYDQLFYDYSREKDEVKKNNTLNKLNNTIQFKFEQEVERHSNMQFDDLIFFVNKILFFGEDHKTILWDKANEIDVQNELFNKYFNDKDLNLIRQESDRQAKYYDTQARHRSEDMRVIRKVLDKIEKEDQNKTDEHKIREKVDDLKREKEHLNDKLKSIQENRTIIDRESGILNKKMNDLSLEVSQIEVNHKKIENQYLKDKWVTLHRNYDIFEKSLTVNEICPLCSQDLEEEFLKKKVSKEKNCILCEQLILDDVEVIKPEKIEQKKKVTIIHDTIRNFQKKIYDYENQLAILDSNFKKQSQQLRELNSQIRSFEYNLLKTNNENSKPKDNLQSFYDEISSLELKKDQFQEKSRKHKLKSEEISGKIEEEILKNVLKFSNLFSGYAEKFLGLKCSLTYEEINNKKRFFPVIDGKIREQEEELSESQRFFVDHSFRMSILSFFYNNSSFYIVETPDSSLDISYERNAADVFIKFLEKPYCLILTTNLNNSEFLSYLTKTAENVSIINLLEIGKKSPIQENSAILTTTFEKVKKHINER